MEATSLWNKLQHGIDWHNKNSIYSDTDKYYNFYEGDQWEGIESGDETLPMHNFITPVCDFKIAMVAMNLVAINYSPLDNAPVQDTCDELNKYAASVWERKKMDTIVWEIIKQACVSGDSYLYFYNSKLDNQIIDRANIYFADEQNPNIQEQKYIIIYERRFVEDVKEDARRNGIDENDIDNITPDDDTDTMPDNVKGNEVQDTDKCSCLLYLTKKDGIVHISRSTKNVIYQPDTPIVGVSLYPIAPLLWKRRRGSSRGIGVVGGLIPNQIVTNKLLARRDINIKMTGFAKPVYNSELIENPADVEKIGTAIRISGRTVQAVDDAFKFIAPSPASQDASLLQTEIITLSRDLVSAGDNATGNINPQRASGSAILAVKDQQAIATNQPTAAYKQFVEDVASIWLNTWAAYEVNDLDTGNAVIPSEVLQSLQVKIRIDISPSNPYSKYSQMSFVDNLFAGSWYDNTQKLEEYYNMLPNDGNIPKDKLRLVIEARKALIKQQAEIEGQLEGEIPGAQVAPI